jgi:hypothetical protein
MGCQCDAESVPGWRGPIYSLGPAVGLLEFASVGEGPGANEAGCWPADIRVCSAK